MQPPARRGDEPRRVPKRQAASDALAFLVEQGECPQESALRCVKPPARPVDRRAGERVHGLGRDCDRLVMVAEERDGAFFDHAGYGVDEVGGIGAVGQPRDGNPAACYALLDHERSTLASLRVPYDIDAAAQKIVKAGLPPGLAARLYRGV